MKRLRYECGSLYGGNVRRICSDYAMNLVNFTKENVRLICGDNGMNAVDFMRKMCDGYEAIMV